MGDAIDLDADLCLRTVEIENVGPGWMLFAEVEARLLAAKLCVEVDGEAHSWRLDRDEVRDRWLAEQGVKTVRVLARDVLRDLDAVVTYIVAQAPSDVLRTPPPPVGEDC